ncbi:uncharacterized protein LOC105103855 isoform X2 [Camelus dromedarius]|uniref:uncharacterized protein LOC105103855 isoform X2 n=1 Tax=Camelus dromedarius TaxID=9838 RepID=UPI00311A4DAF
MWNCAEGGKEAYLRSQSIQCPQGLSLSPHLTGSGTDRSLLGSQPPSMGSRLRTPPSLLGITPHSLISFLVATRTTTSVYVKHKTLTGGVLNGGRATELTEGGLRRPPGAPEFRRVKEQEAAWLSLCMKSQARIPALGQQYNDCEQILSTTSCQRVQDPRGSIQQVPLKSGAQVQTALGQRGRVTCGPALVGVSCALHPPNTAPEGFCQDTRATQETWDGQLATSVSQLEKPSIWPQTKSLSHGRSEVREQEAAVQAKTGHVTGSGGRCEVSPPGSAPVTPSLPIADLGTGAEAARGCNGRP